MTDLTKEERAWLKRLQTVLNACPSDRLGFYTIGDPEVTVYDRSVEAEIDKLQDSKGCDFCIAVDELDARLGDIKFPKPVHSTAG